MKKERTIEQLRADFLKMYANLPFNVRKEIIAVIDNQPATYFVCWLEVKEKTKKGDEILYYLERLDLV